MADQALVIDRAPAAEALTWPDRARALVIATGDDYATAAEMLKGIKGLRQRIVDTFGPHVKRAFDAHKALVAEQRQAEEPLSQAEAAIKSKLLAYDTEQHRLRRAEEQRLSEAARKADEQRRLDEAALLELEAQATGNAALAIEAEAIISEPVTAPVVSLPSFTPKVAGISYRETWAGECYDLAALCRHIGTHPEHANLIAPNIPAINGLARSLRSSLAIPGIRAVAKREIASGR